jgi:hypothetical protein
VTVRLRGDHGRAERDDRVARPGRARIPDREAEAREVQEFLRWLRPNFVSRADARHRGAHGRRENRIVGERRFLGLFRARAYQEEAEHIPILRHKLG